MRDKDGYLQPALLQALGIVMLIGFAIDWALTGAQSAVFIGAALTLIGIGSAGGAIVLVREDLRERSARHQLELEQMEEGQQSKQSKRSKQ